MHTIHLQSTTYQIPSQWDELTSKQLRQIALLSTLGKKPVQQAKLFFLILTSALPLLQRLRLQWFYLSRASTDERGDLLLLGESFSTERNLTRQLLPKIRYRSVLLYGPRTGLANSTFYEYILAEKAFLDHTAAPQGTPHLDRLISILYRPQRSDFDREVHADRRAPLLDATIPDRARLIAKMTPATRIAILIWFDSCRQRIIRSFPLIFGKGASGAEPSRAVSGNPWLPYISELAGSMTQYEAVGQTNLMTALTDISFRIQKSIDAKKEAAKTKRKKS